MSDIRLAIVGSVKFAHPRAHIWAEGIIGDAIEEYRPQLIISGGAKGIDTIARTIATLGFSYKHVSATAVMTGLVRAGSFGCNCFVEYLPANQRWAPDGFKDRNRRMAEDCTHLLAIRCHASKTYGSGWTADEAERQGRTVWRVML